MISPVIASDKATVNTHLQVRWDLRTPATPEHLDGNGAIPDLTRAYLCLMEARDIINFRSGYSMDFT